MIDRLVAELGLTPHPEGGFFRETYRAGATLPGTNRSVSTAILYLLGAGQRSKLHRIDADEVWHFYRGGPLEVIELTAAGARITTLSVEHPQHVVSAGTWFGSRPAPGTEYALVGCTVAPGFEFAHFELGTRAALTSEFPNARDVIKALT
ncbi:MAG: cupin domain-containing protein [Archangium sp.]